MTQSPDYQARGQRVAARVDAPCLVVSDLVNVRYLTGFTGSNASVVLSAAETVLVTDGRYVDQAAAQCPHAAVVVSRATDRQAIGYALGRTGSRVAFEAEHVSVAEHARLAELFPDADLVPTSGAVELVRRSKDPGERALIARACALIGEAVAAVVAEARLGISERRIARRLHELVIDAGADGMAFAPIVAAGLNAAFPHHEPTDRELRRGDLLKIDAGVLVGGYHSDLTRVFVVAAEPTAQQLELHAAVAAAAAAARAAVAPGVPAAQVDAAARSQLARAGYEDRFTHGLGHGVGLQIHEAPMLGRDATVTIEAGDVLTIEPGAYLPGFGGVRIEDTLAVTDDSVECLTTVPRDLIRIG